ncbi:MAG: sigma-70 family RNA polymerase sigma factor [Verrucomicrobiales bacterium]|nr:sigma-70 family RNA polymerase sigma factor [Verrucomicrobiales bacterium]
MSEIPDQKLIREYARHGAEESFGELVHRHVDLVYSTAFRVLRNPDLAEEVSQRVFVALARNAATLEHRAVLAGWLHQTARNFALATVRSEERRRRREREAATLRDLDLDDTPAVWDQIAPHLDTALAQLDEADRDAILLRYFERKTAKEIGERLGLTAEAAQKRATRALDRLRMIFAERGLAAPTAGLANLLSVQAVQSAPVGLTASVIAAAGTAETITTATSTIGLMMASTKIKIGLTAALAAAVSIPLVIQHQTNTRLLGEIATLRQHGTELARLREELQRLSAEAQSLAEQRGKERMELARLRGELAATKTRQTKTASAARSTKAGKSRTPVDTSEAAKGELVQRDEWRNVGFQAPSLTVQTLEWAKANGDTNVIANALAWADENSRAGVEAIFAAAPESVRARYGSADEYVLSLFNHSGPLDDRHTLLSYRILEANVGEDEAILQLEYHYADGSTPTGPQRYVRIGNEWRQALDFDAPSQGKMSVVLQAEGENRPAEPSGGK